MYQMSARILTLYAMCLKRPAVWWCALIGLIPSECGKPLAGWVGNVEMGLALGTYISELLGCGINWSAPERRWRL